MVTDACPIPNRDGSVCRAKPTASGICFSHDPGRAEQRRRSRINGGFGKSRKARAQKLLPEDLQALDAVLSGAITGVFEGSLLPGQGSAIAALAGARVRVREIALKLAEQTELMDRISRLEEKLDEFNVARGRNGKGSRHVF
jgi:hypothetical protein